MSNVLHGAEQWYPEWVVELSQYDIFYKPRATIKAQALAEFINEATPIKEDEKWFLHVDGSSTITGSGAGVIFTSPEGDELEYTLRFHIKASNNKAKY
ncbi:UNVERIFIED_CONTAM: hypothetical protein Slati_3445100 [Sesamum latifolium]|uniref:Reverse transcriptase/retrotransposon-derived protein RNase H-like domain-containing protein n=1 Tax=Sesamum latifolium TaxID=2727402 RepID=A0AAW2UIF8_9LAMI